MALWVYALPDTRCGSCGVPIPDGLPVALVTPAKLPRCTGCAFQLGLTCDPTALPASPEASSARALAIARLDALRRQRRLDFDPNVHAGG